MENYLLSGSKYELLKITARIDKDRAFANEFLKELKFAISNKLRANVGSTVKLSRLVKLDTLITEKAPLLETNINLALFFSGFISKL